MANYLEIRKQENEQNIKSPQLKKAQEDFGDINKVITQAGETINSLTFKNRLCQKTGQVKYVCRFKSMHLNNVNDSDKKRKSSSRAKHDESVSSKHHLIKRTEK